MYKFIGRFVYLEELTTKNDKELFGLMKDNEIEYRLFVSDFPVSQKYEDFQKQLDNWFSHGRNFQFLVYKKDNKDFKKELIGTIFFYGWSKEKKTIKISIYFTPKYRKSIFIGEALGAALLFVKQIIKINELLFDCYVENKEMIELAYKIGSEKLGESQSELNPERKLINFILSRRKIDEWIDKFIRFENRETTIK